MASAKILTAVRRGYTVQIKVNPRYLPEAEGHELETLLERTVDDFAARHIYSVEKHMTNKNEPPVQPEVKTTHRTVVRPWYSWVCKYPLSQRKKCSTKIEGPNVGPVQHSANQHWAKHTRENGGA